MSNRLVHKPSYNRKPKSRAASKKKKKIKNFFFCFYCLFFCSHWVARGGVLAPECHDKGSSLVHQNHHRHWYANDQSRAMGIFFSFQTDAPS